MRSLSNLSVPLRKLPKFTNLAPQLNSLSPISYSIQNEIDKVLMDPPQVPAVVGNIKYQNMNQVQYAAQNVVCHYHRPTYDVLREGLDTYQEAKEKWNKVSLTDRLDIFLDAADKLEYEYYEKMMAYTIVGQNKTPYEAEIDSICELVDFLRFNVSYVYELHQKQPISPACESFQGQNYMISNYSQYLPLNGFVASMTPFNFTAIGGNLALTPLMLGNAVFWKPSDSAILSNYLIYQILEESGLPPGILNFVPYDGAEFLDVVTQREDLGGLIFTGSSQVFDNIYGKVSSQISKYKSYPRLIGETGGKNYHFVHPSMAGSVEYIAGKTFESAFGYSGQKCSACSRIYLPESMLDDFLNYLQQNIESYLSVHQNNYGIIHRASWDKSSDLVRKIKQLDSNNTEIVLGGKLEEKNLYMEPTVVVCSDPQSFLFRDEFFAPLLTIYPYQEDKVDQTVELCRDATDYALTGAVFSLDGDFLEEFEEQMKHTCGNYYINDKSTGSVVGQQPFGGSGKSGTNDKAGDINFIYRLANQRNVKKCFYDEI